MAISVEIDRQSGFCGGVIRAIGKAEEYLDAHPDGRLYSLGAIVHNEAELERLSSKGLVTIDRDDLSEIHEAAGETLLIRAHGEPPKTYDRVSELGFRLIDCTCPVVLRLQQNIREAYVRLHGDGRDGQLLIFGKIGHAEVLGLVGQVDGDAVVIENRPMLEEALEKGHIRLDRPVEIFSQTTKSPAEYADICASLENRMAACHGMEISRFRGTGWFRAHDTICSQVANRHAKLTEFALNQWPGSLRTLQVAEHPDLPHRFPGRNPPRMVPGGRQGRGLRRHLHAQVAARTGGRDDPRFQLAAENLHGSVPITTFVILFESITNYQLFYGNNS